MVIPQNRILCMEVVVSLAVSLVEEAELLEE
jgi:hypothetical protein